MNYIGSKYSLLDFIYSAVEKENIKGNVICDLFAGTHAVGKFFKSKGYQVISNDWQYYSYVLGMGYIKNNEVPVFEGLSNIVKKVSNDYFQDVIDYLNNIEGQEGFIYNNYCLGGTQGQEFERMYFTDDNGKKCDAIRIKIQEWYDEAIITEDEYFVLLTSLLESIDAVANTASVYGAFLKHYKKTALKPITLKKTEIILGDKTNKVYNTDALEVINDIECDILYLDPPYNARQYAANYHILETIAAYDNPVIKGKTGLREYEEQKSDFCSKVKVVDAFRTLIERTKAKHILLSYNTEGLMPREDIEEILNNKGDLTVFTMKYKRFRADNDSENRVYKVADDRVKEMLFSVKVR